MNTLFHKYITFSLLLFLLSCSNTSNHVIDEIQDDIIVKKEDITVEKKFDSESQTFYYLTFIKHKNEKGEILKLEHSHSNKLTGETALDFSKRISNPTVAINASTMSKLNDPPGAIEALGIQIVDGKVMKDKASATAYTLGIKENNELIAFEPGVRAKEILDAGIINALTAFMPLIEDFTATPIDSFSSKSNIHDKHPRQVIAQYDNLDLLILSCGGRGFDGKGMRGKDIIRILLKKGVKFAFNLDGGGSVTTVIDGDVITKKIDKNGTELRLRPNFLFVR